MSRIIPGAVICVSILAGYALLARLPLSTALIEGVALISMLAILFAVEWPRWYHASGRRWPNKLGEI